MEGKFIKEWKIGKIEDGKKIQARLKLMQMGEIGVVKISDKNLA